MVDSSNGRRIHISSKIYITMCDALSDFLKSDMYSEKEKKRVVSSFRKVFSEAEIRT